MIKVSVLYPNNEDTTFDFEYYCNTHIEMVRGKLGAQCKKVTVEQGLSGGTPDADATYIAMGNLYFDSVEDFQASFGPHAAEIIADIPNYTNVEPIIQVSEVKI